MRESNRPSPAGARREGGRSHNSRLSRPWMRSARPRYGYGGPVRQKTNFSVSNLLLHEMRQGEPRTSCRQWGQRPPSALTRIESLAGGERHPRVAASAHDIEATVEGERG